MESDLQDISERISEAAARGTPLRIVGGGSKEFYGQSLHGALLDMRCLTGITSYEPSELYVTARAGTPLAELESLLASSGQCLPFEPPRFGTDGASGGTVGGMVAAGLSGPARANVGSVRDYVLGATLLNGKGELLTFGGQVMKNVAGYDVSRLLAGSLGTLGVIADVSLKVLPVAPAEATLRFGLDQAAALRRLNEWGGRPLPLNASCWADDGGGVLHVRLRGAVAAVESACRSMGGERVEAAGAYWDALRDQTHDFFSGTDGCLWRLSVAQGAPAIELPYPQWIEWHGGLRWLRAPAGEAALIRAAAARAGGHATLFRAEPGAEKPGPVFAPLAAPLDRIHRELKKQFDPAGIFNRGRMYAEF